MDDSSAARCQRRLVHLACQRGGVRSGSRSELSKDVPDVSLDGLFTDIEPLGDLAVPQALRNQRENLPLSRREKRLARKFEREWLGQQL